MKNLFDLTGKRALITGSAQGIGNLLASGLAAHGAEIVINDITQLRAQVAADKLVAEGYRAVGYGFDVTNGEEVACAIAQLKRKLGPLIF